MEWAIEVCKETGKPVAASMCIGPEGDLHGVSIGECGVRMAKAGADVGKYKSLVSFAKFSPPHVCIYNKKSRILFSSCSWDQLSL